MTVLGKSYETPEAQFERRYAMLVFHGHVNMEAASGSATCDAWMTLIDESTLLDDDAVYADGSLRSFIEVSRIGGSVIERVHIVDEVNDISPAKKVRTTNN